MLVNSLLTLLPWTQCKQYKQQSRIWIKRIQVLAVLSFSVFTAVSHAESTSTPQGLEYCTVCHGAQLKGNINIGAPRLSGLSQWYIERQLLNFKQGIRGAHHDDDRGMEMRPMVINLSAAQIKDIAQWVAATKSPPPKQTVTANRQAGKQLFGSCAACHGSQGKGNEAIGAPALTGLNDWYLITQLNHFRQQIRGAHATDLYGQQMLAASAVISSDEDVENLAAYISTLSNTEQDSTQLGESE